MTRWSIVNIVTAITTLVAVALITASGIALLSSYRFDRDLAHASLQTISSNLQSGGLPFAVAAQDMELISSIVNHQLKNDLIYAIEVYDRSNQIIYREDKDTSESVEITKQVLDLSSPYKAIAFNDIDPVDSEPNPRVGSVSIYFTTEKLDAIIIQQAIFVGCILLVSIIFIVLLLYLFNRLISVRLARAMTVIQTLERGERPEWNEDEAPSILELRIIYNGLKHLSNTILDRDLRLKQSLEEAISAKHQAQQADQFKDDFIRRISHDIRTPVGVVTNLLNIIHDEAKNARLGNSLSSKLNACMQSALILNDVTQELFNFEQFERQQLIESRSPVDIEAFFSRLHSLYEYKFSDKGIGFSCRRVASPPRWPVISLDHQKVTLILENLLDNALKFTRTGAVSLEWALSDNLKVSVRDSGVGIAEDKIKIIFDKHIQLEKPNTTIRQGRGLGLFYVSRLCEAIGAKVSISSKPGIGTCFNLQIPYVEVETTSHANIAALDPGSFAMDTTLLSSLKVLIIDDDEGTCFTLIQMLAQFGVQATKECIPELGYKRILDETPDLVFIDYQMPGLLGDELAHKAKSKLSNNATFLVCITAQSSPEILSKLASVFSEIYAKPFNPARLQTILERVVRSKSIAKSIIDNLRS